MEKYLDVSLPAKERARDLLGKMSLDEKMGQIVGYNSAMWSQDKLEEDYPHGAGQVSGSKWIELHSLEEMSVCQRDLQDRIMALSDHHIPAIFHMEGLCGAMIMGAESFPSGIARASSFDPQLEEQVGEVTGRQAGAAGASMVFAPVLDISRDSRFGRQGESYGEDPALAAAMGTAYIKGLQRERSGQQKVMAAAKHFLGYHDAQGGIHAANCDIPDRLLREVYAKPFQAAVTKGGLRGIMPCYSAVNGEPAAGSHTLLTKLLREELGFDGLTVSDYCAVSELHERQRVCDTLAKAGEMALRAGMDTELPSRKSFNEELKKRFETGEADIQLLNRAVTHVLEEKFRLGLFEHPYGLEGEELESRFGREDDAAVSLQAARESMVLLKNDGILPLSDCKGKKIAVIGEHAASIRIFFGGYTYMSMVEAWLGTAAESAEEKAVYPGSRVQRTRPGCEALAREKVPGCRSLLDELTRRLPGAEVVYSYGYPYAGDDASGYDEALKIAAEADLVIVTLGGKYGTGEIASMGEGVDGTNINLPVCQERFLERLEKLKKPVVAVHLDGRPISSNEAEKAANAILEAWSPAQKGAEAMVDILLGTYNPGGKLPVSAAYHAGQIPVYYNHANGSSYHQNTGSVLADYVDCPHEPRYFFGHGLSYTTFSYLGMELGSHECKPTEKLKVIVTLKNTGNCRGDEVVQLYIKDRYASLLRPVMELAGFCRVSFLAGEQKKVVFTLHLSQLAFLEEGDSWKVEAGEVDVLAGSSSADIRLKDCFHIASDGYLRGREREFWAQTEVLQ